MNRFRNWMTRVMQGRYGNDYFGQFLVAVALILCIVSCFTKWYVYLAAIVIIAYEYFRMFSKNYTARRRENDIYMKATGWFRKLFKLGEYRDVRNANYKIFKCPKCKQKLRVPRGRGKIEIRCRKCSYQFIRRT